MSGLMLSTLSTASYLAHTVFATAHLHFLMMGGVLTALLAGLDTNATIGMWILTTGLVMVLSNLYGTLHDGPPSRGNYWGATTAEWRDGAAPVGGDPYRR
jgi:heme/copper-type cytochrome/quinol oxidase subunit 1